MFRAIGGFFALLLFAAASSAEEDRSAYAEAQARLTEQLNAVIAEGVVLDQPAPPAKRDEAGEERQRKPADPSAAG